MAFSMPAGVSTIRGARMAFALREEESLDDDRAEGREIDQIGVLDAIAEAAARGDQRILEVSDPMRVDRSISRALPPRGHRHERRSRGYL